jgi:hypothetical protein
MKKWERYTVHVMEDTPTSGADKSLAPQKGAFTFTAPESKQKYLLTCRDRTAERCFASKQNRELVPRQNFLTKKF